MAAGLNQMVVTQSKMAIKNHNTEHRVKAHTYKPGNPNWKRSKTLTVCRWHDPLHGKP